MAERPPSHPRVAWEKVVTPRECRTPLEPYEVSTVQPLQTDDEWSCEYREEQETVDFIQAFVSSPEEYEDQKMEFLDSICMLCRTANHHVLPQGLDAFCYTYDLAENIKALLQKEPGDQLSTEVRWKAMLAIATLSSVGRVLEGREESLLEACFSRVFFLPPRAEMRGLTLELYICTLDAMDNMLQALVLNCSIPRVTELVQNIFQMLLNFTNSETVVVRVRALEMIRTLSNLLAKNPTLEAWDHFRRDMYGPICYGDLQIPILGQLLGRLLLFYSSKEETSLPAHDALLALSRLIHNQESRSAPKGKAQELHWKPDRPSILYQPTTRDFVMEFAEHLRCWEMTDVVLAAIEAMTDSSMFDKEAARSLLDLFMRYPGSWLADVPKIMSCIHKNLECINMESARQSMGSLLLTLTNQDPMKVVLSLLKLPLPGDSNGTAMWEVMLSVPQTLENIFEELLSHVQGRKSHSLVKSTIENAYITHLLLMTSTEFQSEDCGNAYQRRPSLMTASLLLRCLIPLSETRDMARKMPVLLPQIREFLEHGDTNIKTNILVVFRNVMGHLERKEASPIAVQLAEKLLPLFDAESSQLRELSISLFRDLVEAVVGNKKRMMKKEVQRTLLPLFFHMQDKTDSVSKASREALLAAAELLRWKELKDLVQPQQMWRMVEYSLLQDRSKVEVYLKQSLPYLKNTQATLREAAIRFIGLAAQHLRDQNEEKLQDICNDLKALMNDTEPSVQSLAAQTLVILGTPRKQQTSGWSLRTLCCWLCRDRER